MARYGMIVNVSLCTGCMTCVLACKQENLTGPGVQWCKVLQIENEETNSIIYARNACMHCDDAPCINACKSGAISRRKDSIVIIDQDRCQGDQDCVKTCPYGVISINSKETYFDKPLPFEKNPVGYKAHQPGKASKCTLCVHRIDEGKLPICVEACQSQALIFGDLDDPNSEISKQIKESKTLLMNEGTKPKITYLTDDTNLKAIEQRVIENPNMLG